MDYLFDIAILALLALLAWRGWARGLALSLCGLAAVFAAFFAAQFVSETFCAPVAGILRPSIVHKVQKSDAEPAASDPQAGYTAGELLASIQEKGLYKGFSDFLERGVDSDSIVPQSPLESLASYLAKGIARAALFAGTFFLVLLLWFLISRALGLAFELPVLSWINGAGGAALGVVKGVLIAMVAVWAGQLLGLVPNPPATPVASLFTAQRLWALLDSLPA